MAEYTDLLNNVFGYDSNTKKKEEIKPYIPEMAEKVDKAEDKKTAKLPKTQSNPNTAAQIQATVWGSGNTPAPQQAKAPTNKMLDQGSASAMKSDKGWAGI